MPSRVASSSDHAAPRRQRRQSRRALVRPRVEELESRALLSAAPLPAAEPDGTLDLAHDLGDLRAGVSAGGRIGDGGAADVDWFQFTLVNAARVTVLERSATGSDLVAVIGVYNDDPWSFGDPENALGHRLLAQASGSADDSEVSLEQTLAAGTYWLAVSGLGNGWFHPFLDGSGHAGSTGDYDLSLTVVEVAGDPGVPSVIGSMPAAGAAVDRSPLVVRINYDAPLDTNTIDLGATQLVYSPSGDFASPDAQLVPLGSVAFSPQANELQVVPAAPLRPGHYGVFLADGSIAPVLRFQVTGIEGAGGSDDSPGTANELFELAAGDVIQVAGAIGDDGTYDLNSADPGLTNPAADVDLFHFRIEGQGNYAFTAEVFAGRVGSRLDPGVSLFRVDPFDGRLHFIDGNDNTLNGVVTTNGMVPLYTDAALFVGLTAGDYFLAVAGGPNTPQRALNTSPGVDGIFDPNTPQSGINGFTVGPYVLTLSLRADNTPPEVVAVTPPEGETLAAPPTRLTVTFSEPVNLGALAYSAFQQTSQSALSPVFVLGAGGERYYPRLESYDESTGVAVFLMLDGLANGAYELHLSAAEGLADFAGNSLVGNDPSGDFVTRFTVAGPERGSAGDATVWADAEPNDDVLAPQDLGVLFPHELQEGVTVVRDFTQAQQGAPADNADYFRFEVLQNRVYVFLLEGLDLPAGVGLTLFDAAGNEVPVSGTDQTGLQAQLAAGTYVLGVSEWAVDDAGGIGYRLRIALAESGDNPAPLTVGPSPVSTTRLVGTPRTITPGRVAATTPVDLPDGIDPPLLTPTLSQEVESAAGTVAAETAAGADVQSALAALASLLISSPATIGNFTDTSTLESSAESPADASFGKSAVPAGLLTSLGAGAVGGVEEDAPRVIDPANAEAKAPDLRLSDDLAPRGGPGTEVTAPESGPVPQAGETWVAQLWEFWCKRATQMRSFLLEDCSTDPATAISAPAQVSHTEEPAAEGMIWVWAPAVAAFVAVNLALHRRSSTAALTPALADSRGHLDEPMP